MSVAILIEFKAPGREDLYVPVAAQGVYSTEWVPEARKLGLKWLPLFRTGTSVDVKDLSDVVNEIRQLRAEWVGNPRKVDLVERMDLILEALASVDAEEVSTVFIG